MLFSLPFDIVLSVLSDRLSIVELGKFDSAVCKKESRKDFLEICSCENFSLLTNDGFYCKDALNWIALREIKLEECFVGAECCELLFKLKTSKIHSLVFQTIDVVTSEDRICSTINSCPKITFIRVDNISGNVSNFLQKVNREILNQLNVFELVDRDGHQQEFKLLDSKFSIIQVWLTFCGSGNHGHKHICISSLFQDKKNDFSIDDYLVSIATRNHCAVNFNLHVCGAQLKFSTFSTIISWCPNLINLSVYIKPPGPLSKCNVFYDKIVDYSNVRRCSNQIHFQYKHYTDRVIASEQCFIDFFDAIKHPIDNVHLYDYPLTNNTIKSMIRNNPNNDPEKTNRTFTNCGYDYDQRLVDNWII
jgi:hypothetical protein